MISGRTSASLGLGSVPILTLLITRDLGARLIQRSDCVQRRRLTEVRIWPICGPGRA